MNANVIRLLTTAARAAVNHLEACEKGQIQHPFKSRSLPLLREALIEAEKAGGATNLDSEMAKKLIVFITRNLERESALLYPETMRNVFLNDPYGLINLIRDEAKLTPEQIDAWMVEAQKR